MIVVDDIFNSGGVHFQAFAERATLAHKHPTALAQRAVDRLDNACLTFTFGTGPVLATGQNGSVDFPLVGEVPAPPFVALGE